MNLWRSDILEDIYKLDPLTKEMITHAETLFDVDLPDEYIKILSIQNGGYLLPDKSTEIQIDHLMGIGSDTGILDTTHFQEEWNLPKGLIRISGDGQEWNALDYRNSRTNPPIVHVNFEEETIMTIASSFNEFLTRLMGSTISNVQTNKLTPSLSSPQDFFI